MSSPVNDTDLELLGLSGHVLGPVETVSAPTADLDERGYAVRDIDFARQPPVEVADLSPVQLPGAAELGYQILREVHGPGRLVVRPPMADTRVRLGRNPPDVFVTVGDDIVVDVARLSGPLAFSDAARPVAYVLHPPATDGTITAQHATRPLDVGAVPARLRAPVLDWCERWGDAWLRDAVAAKLARDDDYQTAAAVGLFARLRPDDDLPVDVLLAEGSPADRAVRELVAAISAETLAELAELLRAEVDLLSGEIDELVDGDPEAAGFADAVRSFLHRRDDLACVWFVLSHAGFDGGLVRDLDGLDEIAAPAVEALARWPGAADDERLVRAATVDVDAWWTLPATEG